MEGIITERIRIWKTLYDIGIGITLYDMSFYMAHMWIMLINRYMI